MLKMNHFFLEKVLSENIHSLYFGSYLTILIQIKPFQTYSIRPPNLFLSLLGLIFKQSQVNREFGKLSSSFYSLKTK